MPANTYKFEVDFDASQDQARTLRSTKIAPLLGMARIGACGEVTSPIDTSRFCPPHIHDVVDMSFADLSRTTDVTR